jgi:hypothetical protein
MTISTWVIMQGHHTGPDPLKLFTDIRWKPSTGFLTGAALL